MKKSVYFSGIICTILMLCGCMFKIMHWPGANVMIMASVFFFCFYFLPFALLNSYKEMNKHKELHIIAFVVFCICVMGVLFKVMHWPGAGIAVMIGLPLPFLVFLPAYLYYTKDEKKEGSTNFLGMMFGLTFLAVFSVLLALTISRQVLGSAVTKMASNDQATSFGESFVNDLKTENAVTKSANDLCTYIDALRCELLTATNNDLCVGGKMRSDYNASQMAGLDDKNTTSYILYGGGTKNKLEDLRLKIDNYRQTLLNAGKVSPELSDLINTLFDVNSSREIDQSGEVNEKSWEQREFNNKQMIFVIDALSQIQSNIRLVELEYLSNK